MKKVIIMLMLLAPLTAFAQKFGKVSTQTVVQTMTDYGKAQGELQALQKQKENELKGLQDELQRKSEEYEKVNVYMPVCLCGNDGKCTEVRAP